MCHSLKILISLILLHLHEINTGRILCIFPTPSLSHQIVFRHITLELVSRGHEVVVLTPDPIFKGKPPLNYTEIDVHDISYKNWEVLLRSDKGKKEDIISNLRLLFECSASTLDLQMQKLEMQEILRKGESYFDLLLLESFNRPLMGIVNIFNAPVIQISSFGIAPAQYSGYGAPMHPLLYPTLERQRLYNLSIWEKAMELIKYVIIDYVISNVDEYDYYVMRKHFGKNISSFHELGRKFEVIFVNEHPIWADNRPVPPNIVFIGGIHKTPQQELPEVINW